MTEEIKTTPSSDAAKDIFAKIASGTTTTQEVADSLFAPPKPIEPNPVPSELPIPAEKVTIINVDDIKPNSIIVINIDVTSPGQKMAVAPAFSKLLAPYASTLREKSVTVMLMAVNESINIIPEEEMNKAGWEKKDKSLIINPFQK